MLSIAAGALHLLGYAGLPSLDGLAALVGLALARRPHRPAGPISREILQLDRAQFADGARDNSSSASYRASNGKPAFFKSCSTPSSALPHQADQAAVALPSRVLRF
jgi:hypothetical protein